LVSRRASASVCTRPGSPEANADVAQLVEHHLAKVRVAGSSPVVRSERVRRPNAGGVAERRGNGLQSRLHGFESRLHLEVLARAIGAVVARFLDTEEVTSSILVSPTNNNPRSDGRYQGSGPPAPPSSSSSVSRSSANRLLTRGRGSSGCAYRSRPWSTPASGPPASGHR
jgi:hypothetical protein